MPQEELAAASRAALIEQATLLPRADDLPAPDIVIIRRLSQADALLFDGGFTRLVGVSYVASLSLIEELMSRGFEEVELVVGDDFGEAYQKELKTKDIERAVRLARRVEEGKLRLYFPAKTADHSKLYLLSKPGRVRILFGSANLTESAKRGRMANMMMSWDLPDKHPFGAQLLKKYETDTRKNCTLFMGDLVEELKARAATDRTEEEVVEAWLNKNPEAEEDTETTAILADLTEKALDPTRNEVPLIVIDLPKSQKTDRKVNKIIGSLNADKLSDGYRVSGLEYARFVQEQWHVPLMTLDKAKRTIRANIRGAVEEFTAPLPDPTQVDAALAHVEDYIHTVDLGVTSNSLLAKQSMFEALLYFLAAPFANERMRAIRERHGAVTRRGPAVLYITGPSSNGKTAFTKFALKLLTGYNIEPVPGQSSFTRTHVKTVRSLRTVFPMVFDDVPAGKNLEGVIKPYWETEWRPDLVFPQLIITSNGESLKEWAKTRVKLVQFDVHFTESKENKDRLSELLARDNAMFTWFSHLYFGGMGSEEFLDDDQLRLARSVMKRLYRHAGRPLPAFFLDRPLEEVHDPGRAEWLRLLQLRKVTLDENQNEAVLDFAADFEPREIAKFEGFLPQAIKHKKTGKSLSVQNPEALYGWISHELWPVKGEPASRPPGSPPKLGFWSKLLGHRD